MKSSKTSKMTLCGGVRWPVKHEETTGSGSGVAVGSGVQEAARKAKEASAETVIAREEPVKG